MRTRHLALTLLLLALAGMTLAWRAINLRLKAMHGLDSLSKMYDFINSYKLYVLDKQRADEQHLAGPFGLEPCQGCVGGVGGHGGCGRLHPFDC